MLNFVKFVLFIVFWNFNVFLVVLVLKFGENWNNFIVVKIIIYVIVKLYFFLKFEFNIILWFF